MDDPQQLHSTREALKIAAEQLVPLLYADLRQMARRERGRSGSPLTLQTTALVHEAYIKLQQGKGFNDRRHFLGAAAIAMRQVLVDHVRSRLRAKRGGGVEAISLDDVVELAPPPQGMSDEEVLEINAALEQLATLDPRLAQVVECRFFAGYSEAETAEVMGASERTVRRDWVQAKAWLYRALHSQG